MKLKIKFKTIFWISSIIIITIIYLRQPNTSNAIKSIPLSFVKKSPKLLHSILQEKIINLSLGKIIYNPPKEMTELEGEIIEARISHNFNKDLTEGLEGRGIPIEEPIKVSTTMTARLSGQTFEILELTDKEQVVPPEKYAEWEWEVTPQKAGDRKLYLSVSAIIKIPELGEKKISLPVMKKKIHVKVNPDKPKEKNGDNIIPIICSVIGAIGVLFGIYFGFKKIKKGRENE